MSDQAFNLLLVALFSSILLAVLSTIMLGVLVPRSSSPGQELFTTGTVPPYSFFVSLKARYFLPWIPVPAGCRKSARVALVLGRIGAAIALLALVTMLIFGIKNVGV